VKQKAQLTGAAGALARAARQGGGAGEVPASVAPPRRVQRAPARPASANGKAVSAPSEAAAKGRFSAGSFGEPSPRRYMLYEPAFREPGPAPLLVLLHGCDQDAQEFAAGTRMNEVAEAAGVVVLYPEQSPTANLLRCWNWYASQGPSGSNGEAALIAAMTRQVMGEQRIDPARVYVAGMSAGGAMAAVLARDFPDLYAALGVHSGVPAGFANDLFSAARLMSSGPGLSAADTDPPGGHGAAVASIVFHGDEDTAVHPSNGQAIHSAPFSDPAWPLTLASLQSTTDPSEGQRGFTRSVESGPGGVTYRELWIVHGAGHAWAGGSDVGKHTDANGPDASREMLRFLLQHRLTSQAG
jgi:poly(hydroxyalkanoate) depolymerase family esterase